MRSLKQIPAPSKSDKTPVNPAPNRCHPPEITHSIWRRAKVLILLKNVLVISSKVTGSQLLSFWHYFHDINKGTEHLRPMDNALLDSARSLPVALHPGVSPRCRYAQPLTLKCWSGRGYSPLAVSLRFEAHERTRPGWRPPRPRRREFNILNRSTATRSAAEAGHGAHAWPAA